MFRPPSRGQQTLARDAAIERQRLLRACRDILEANDSPGRRWLVSFLRNENIEGPPEHIGLPVGRFMKAALQPLREQLKNEFKSLLTPTDQ